MINTPQPKAHFGSEVEFYAKANKIPLGRVGQPEDLVGPVVFLASGGASSLLGKHFWSMVAQLCGRGRVMPEGMRNGVR